MGLLSPYLSLFNNRRIAVTLLLMFASSFPLPLTSSGTTFQVWLARDGVDIKTISMLTLVGLPYNFKFLWSPLLDRFSLPFLHRRAGWIALFQVLLIVSIASMGFFSPSKDMTVIVVLAFGIAFFSASQDIVIDAYRIDLLRPEERGAGAAMIMLGGRLAFLAAGALALMLSDILPWKWVWVSLAGCLLIGLLTTLVSPEPEGRIEPPRTLREAVLEPLIDIFKRPGAIEILFFVVLFKLGDTLAAALLSPFLVGLGFTNTDIGTYNKIFGLIASIAGALVAGGAITRLGVYRCLWVFGLLQAVSNFVFVGLALAGKSYAWMIAAIAVENICGGMGTTAFVAYLMSLCDKRFSATQFALFSSLTSIARTILASRTGHMASALGWPTFFMVTAFCAIPGLILLVRIRKYESG